MEQHPISAEVAQIPDEYTTVSVHMPRILKEWPHLPTMHPLSQTVAPYHDQLLEPQ